MPSSKARTQPKRKAASPPKSRGGAKATKPPSNKKLSSTTPPKTKSPTTKPAKTKKATKEIYFVCNNSANAPETFKKDFDVDARQEDYEKVLFERIKKHPKFIKALSVNNKLQVRYLL